jgi:hypothetical protein
MIANGLQGTTSDGVQDPPHLEPPIEDLEPPELSQEPVKAVDSKVDAPEEAENPAPELVTLPVESMDASELLLSSVEEPIKPAEAGKEEKEENGKRAFLCHDPLAVCMQ